MTPSERRAAVRKAVDNYKQMRQCLRRADILLLELIANPEATDEQVVEVVRMIRGSRQRAATTWRSLCEVVRKECMPYPVIRWLDDNPPYQRGDK